MSTRRSKAGLALSMAALLALTPLVGGIGVAQEDTGQAMVDAEADARATEGGPLWFGAGCCLGVIGVVIAFVTEPSPPPARIIGKSSSYAMMYSQTYRRIGKKEQGKMAVYGWASGCAMGSILYVIAVLTVVEAVDDVLF